MTVRITDNRPASSQEWDSAWKTCDYATYFQSREWSDIWRVYTHNKIVPQPLFITFSDSKTVVLPLATRRVAAGIFKEYLLSPGGTYGGWLCEDGLTAEHVKQLNEFILKNCKQLVWRLNPYDEQAGVWTHENAEADESHAIDLSEGFAAVFKNWSKGHRSAATKSRREGVEIREAQTIEDWRAYFGAYEDSIRRWGDKTSMKYRWELFEELFRRDTSHIKLWLGIYDDKIISGQLCFYAKNHVVYWHGAALEEYFKLRSVHWGLHEAIRNACESGYRWFDFNPSGGHEGVKSFKKGFGASPRQCPVVRVSSGSLRAVRAIAGKLKK